MSIAHIALNVFFVFSIVFIARFIFAIAKAEWEDYKMQSFNDHVITTPGMRYIGATYHN